MSQLKCQLRELSAALGGLANEKMEIYIVAVSRELGDAHVASFGGKIGFSPPPLFSLAIGIWWEAYRDAGIRDIH